mgnify:CR=1 FL=1
MIINAVKHIHRWNYNGRDETKNRRGSVGNKLSNPELMAVFDKQKERLK